MISCSTSVTDTLYRVIPGSDAFIVMQQEPGLISCSISVGDILTLIGMLASFIAFWWQLRNTRLANKENLRSTWFLEVIVEPNIEMINTFYKSIIENCDKAISDLSTKYNEGISAKEINTELARQQRILKDKTKTELEHFQSMLRASEPTIADAVDLVIDDLVDIVTKYIDGYEDYSTGQSIKMDALNNKQKFISQLYKGWNNSE